MKLLGPKFLEQTPESLWSYANELNKHHGIKRPESSKPKLKKTRKKKQDENRRQDIN